jgi:hypothetical protein
MPHRFSLRYVVVVVRLVGALTHIQVDDERLGCVKRLSQVTARVDLHDS